MRHTSFALPKVFGAIPSEYKFHRKIEVMNSRKYISLRLEITQVSGVEVTDILNNDITKLDYIVGIEVPWDFRPISQRKCDKLRGPN